MTERNTVKATFTIERTYPAKPARVFKAFSDEQSKRKWFGGGSDWEQLENAFDFRVDGVEINIGRHASGIVSAFYCTYHDIVPDRRIVYAYRMTLDGKPLSSSLASIELEPAGEGTRLTLTEYGVYFDGYDAKDVAGREHGTNWLMDKLGESLAD
jgi:uncharacterized protein YndB with AHSA1/START domain